MFSVCVVVEQSVAAAGSSPRAAPDSPRREHLVVCELCALRAGSGLPGIVKSINCGLQPLEHRTVGPNTVLSTQIPKTVLHQM